MYPLITEVGYSDANGYPFTAISCRQVPADAPRRSAVTGKINPIQLVRRGTMEVALTNSADVPLDVAIRPVVSSEFRVDDLDTMEEFPAKSHRQLKIPIQNFAATPASRYVAFLVVEYDHEGAHYTAVLPTIIDVAARPGLFSMTTLYAVVPVLVLLGIMGVILRARNRKNQHPKAKPRGR